jgi:ubiquinone/menaquinone biosynthesis C-methylase UbiE
VAIREGWQGWDDYAPFYDWENARTVGRADVPFWRRVATDARGPVLELGCGTGRLVLPLVRAGVSLVGIDRSAQMLARASERLRRINARHRGRVTLVRGDIRALPLATNHFKSVIAGYGILQSLTRERDLAATLESVSRVLKRGGLFGVDLVPDVPNWQEYQDRVRFRGPAPGGARLTLIESVRQDRARRLTTFEQRYVTRKNGDQDEHRFTLTFRTIPVPGMIKRLEAAGFEVDRVLGDYQGRPWDRRADVWIILAKKV